MTETIGFMSIFFFGLSALILTRRYINEIPKNKFFINNKDIVNYSIVKLFKKYIGKYHTPFALIGTALILIHSILGYLHDGIVLSGIAIWIPGILILLSGLILRKKKRNKKLFLNIHKFLVISSILLCILHILVS